MFADAAIAVEYTVVTDEITVPETVIDALHILPTPGIALLKGNPVQTIPPAETAIDVAPLSCAYTVTCLPIFT